MTFNERMIKLFDQGMTASKELAVKAGAKAQDLGERGVRMVEIKQLEYKAQKLIGRLGNEVYQAFTERKQDSVERSAPEIESLLSEISKTREALEQKENEQKIGRV